MGQAYLFGGSGGFNTSDATIKNYDVANGKTAYGAKGQVAGSSNLSFEKGIDTAPLGGGDFSIAYGNNKYIAIEKNSGILAYSNDGISWSKGYTLKSGYWTSIVYGNGLFVAVNAEVNKEGIVAYSTDGINWSFSSLNTVIKGSPCSIAYGNGVFLITNINKNNYFYSTDGINWILRDFPTYVYSGKILYGNGKFLIIESGIIYSSPDGITWNSSTIQGYYGSDILCDHGIFLYIKHSNSDATYYYSTDCITWTKYNLPSAGYWNGIVFGFDKFILMSDTIILESTDGINWTAHTPNNQGLNWKNDCRLIYSDNKIVGITTYNSPNLPGISLYSYDGIVWNYDRTNNLNIVPLRFSYLYYCKDKFILNIPYSLYSFDYSSKIYKKINIGAGLTQPLHTAYGNGKFVCLDYNSNRAAYSTDLENWTQVTIPSSGPWKDILYAANKFVAVANNGIIAYSVDGIAWSTKTITGNWQSIAYGNGKFVVGGGKSVAYSSDGINWYVVSISSDVTDVTFGNGVFVTVGNGTSSYSVDGVTWNVSSLPSHSRYDIIYFKEKFITPDSNSKKCYYSTDGMNWTEFEVEEPLDRIVTSNNIAITNYGNRGGLRYSSDGINWYELEANIDQYQATNLPLEITVEGGETKVLREVTTSTLSEKAVGDSVFLNVNGVLTEFLVVHQGLPSSMYDSSCNGTWLLMKDLYEKRAWDSSNNDYANSDIHAYLNGTFLGLFDSNIQTAIKQVKLPYQNGTGSGGSVISGSSGLSTRVFLPAAYELNYGSENPGIFPADGSVLDYFTSVNSMDRSKCIGYYNGAVTAWWLRSPSIYDDSKSWYVTSNGAYDMNACSTMYGIRPALIFDSSIGIKDDGSLATELVLSSLITFTIEGVSYTAYEGMTWGEWVESKYSKGEDGSYFIISESIGAPTKYSADGTRIGMVLDSWPSDNVVIRSEAYYFD